MIMFARVLGMLVMFGMAAALAETGVRDRAIEGSATVAEMIVHRSPSCGCCGKWIDRMKQQGFLVKDVSEVDMDAVKARLGIPEKLKSCHTAEIGGYVVEGHVPAADIKRLLTDRPHLAGLAVPGMPVGPPGMEMGARKDPFSVLGFSREGKTSVFTDYRSY